MTIAEKISYWASMHVLGLLPTSAQPDIADELLENGYESPELLMLSLPSEASHETFLAAFEEIGVSMPDRRSAEKNVIINHIDALLTSQNPLDLLYAILNIRDVICGKKNGCYVCSIPGLNDLANCHWAYEELVGLHLADSDKIKLEDKVKKLAIEVKTACLTSR